MKLADGTSDGSYCVMAVLRKGGYDVPVSSFTAATNQLLANCAVADTKTAGADPHRGRSDSEDWCLVGALLAQGQSFTQGKVQLRGKHGFVGVGDANVQDVDLVITGHTNAVLGQDIAEDAKPYVTVCPAKPEQGSLRITNVASNGRALVLAAIL